MKIRLQKIFLPRHRRRRVDANAFCGVPCTRIFTTSCSFDSPSCKHAAWGTSIADVISAPLWAGGGGIGCPRSFTADGRTGLAHKCLQTPLTFARSLILSRSTCALPSPPHITNGQLLWPRVSTFVDAVMIRKGGTIAVLACSPFRFTDSQIGGDGGLTDRDR